MSLEYITAENFTTSQITHGFFTRKGGVSQGIYQGLNCGMGSNDDTSNVIENRFQAAIHMSGRRDIPLLNCHQIHSNKVISVNERWPDNEKPEADAMVTSHPNIILGILTADCAPVLFHDPVAKIIGAAHAGWQGALSGVVENTLTEMEKLGSSRDNIHVAVGPTIGAKNYEIGEEFYERFLLADKNNVQFFWSGKDETHHQFDLKHFVKSRLENAGIKNPWISADDTYASESLFYSYRRSCHRNEPDYGRELSAIMLKA